MEKVHTHKLKNKIVGIDKKMYANLYDSKDTDAIAVWVYIKCLKKHPHFKRGLTKKNKPQSITRILSESSGLSYNTIDKHLPKLLQLGLIRYDDKKVMLVGSDRTVKISIEQNIRQECKANNLHKQKAIFKINDKMTYSDIKFLVRNVVVATHKIASINRALINNEKNAVINGKIEFEDLSVITSKRTQKSAKAFLNGKFDKNKIKIDDLSVITPYCAISNKHFSKINGTTSISAGYRAKSRLASLGVINERRKQLKLAENVSYSQFLNMKEQCSDMKVPIRYFNGIVYKDLANEIVAVNTEQCRYDNCFYKNAEKNIISIPKFNANKILTAFNVDEYIEQVVTVEPVIDYLPTVEEILPMPSIEANNYYCIYFGYNLSQDNLDAHDGILSAKPLKKAWYMKYNRNADNECYLTSRDLRYRLGWDKKMIDLFIKGRCADKVAYTPEFRSYRTFSLSTIIEIETSNDFKQNLNSNTKRKEFNLIKRLAKVQ